MVYRRCENSTEGAQFNAENRLGISRGIFDLGAEATPNCLDRKEVRKGFFAERGTVDRGEFRVLLVWKDRGQHTYDFRAANSLLRLSLASPKSIMHLGL